MATATLPTTRSQPGEVEHYDSYPRRGASLCVKTGIAFLRRPGKPDLTCEHSIDPKRIEKTVLLPGVWQIETYDRNNNPLRTLAFSEK